MAKLLIVESDDTKRARYHEILERASHEVIEARSATEAVEHCQKDHPDLVLLDPHLGRYLGFTKGKWVADASHNCGSAPVVVIAEEDERPEAEALGPDAIVPAASEDRVLVDTVDGLLS